jgi:hypothetical protein
VGRLHVFGSHPAQAIPEPPSLRDLLRRFIRINEQWRIIVLNIEASRSGTLG